MKTTEAEIQKALVKFDAKCTLEMQTGFLDKDTCKDLRKHFFQALHKIVEVERRQFISILDQTLSETFETNQEKIQGKDLNGAMFHYFIFQKLKSLSHSEDKEEKV